MFDTLTMLRDEIDRNEMESTVRIEKLGKIKQMYDLAFSVNALLAELSIALMFKDRDEDVIEKQITEKIEEAIVLKEEINKLLIEYGLESRIRDCNYGNLDILLDITTLV